MTAWPAWPVLIALLAPDSSIGGEPPPLPALTDTTGAVHALDNPEGRPTVLVFLGIECPLARAYVPRLNELARRFSGRGPSFFAVDSNIQDSGVEAASFVKTAGLEIPLLLDPDARLADMLGATRTPEAVVLDGQGRVVYQGRIDDQFGVEYQRPAPRSAYLAEALADLLADKPVRLARTEPVGCFIGRASSPATQGAITWSGRIAKIVSDHCLECHRPGQLAPFSLTNYADAAAWRDTIAEVVAAGRMPPWHADPAYGHFANDRRLTGTDRQAFLDWIAAGAPEGQSAPLLRAESDSPWRIGTPDQIVALPTPFAVPADGTVQYQWFHVDPGFHADRWIHATEVRPGNRAVVHHATVYVKPRGQDWDLRLNDRIDLLGGFNPGGDPWIAPPETAMLVRAGSELVFEMHYTPGGVATTDQTAIGLVFADPRAVRRQVHCAMPAATDFVIPPGEDNYRVEASFLIPADARLLLLRPHMHLRGKSFRYEAIFPDARREILLDVPRYDFNWQHSYVLAEPKFLPLGTEIRCTAHFDNSADNPSNPDPTASVHWGDQSYEEMMIGILSLVFADEDRIAHPSPLAVSRPISRLPVVLFCLALLAAGLVFLLARAWSGGGLARTLSVLLLLNSAAGAEPTETMGKPVGPFELQDPHGNPVASSTFEGRPLVAVFLGVECPLCRLYVPRLATLARAFEAKGVTFIGIDSNQQDSLAEITAFGRTYPLGFPLLKDPGNLVADQFGAERTPEAFLLDAEGVVRYRGRIDDQFGVGTARPAATRDDLAAAITNLLAGRATEPTDTPSAPPVPGCLIGRRKSPREDSPVTWSNSIARIFQQRCQRCHRAGQIAPFALVDHSEAAGWAEMIGEVVAQRRMPPWLANPAHGRFANDLGLADSEREAILAWVAAGAPLGDPGTAPPLPPVAYPEGWQIPEPDQIIAMSKEPFAVGAEGVLDYQYFTVDPGWTEDRWLQAVECRAGNRSVVHHMAVFLWLPGTEWIDSFKHFLSGNAQGWGHMHFPEGTARRIPAGTRFVFTMHYAPNGTPQSDNSFMGVVFADPKSVTRSCRTVVAARDDFEIPPHAANFRLQATHIFETPVELISLFPHMHLRGKSFRYTARYPDGTEEILLDIPRYDFGWQEYYALAEPKPLPAGTQVICDVAYDNSADNPQNPDPNVPVVWGFQSTDEMLDGHMQVAVPVSAEEPVAPHEIGLARRLVCGATIAAVVTLVFLRLRGRRREQAPSQAIPWTVRTTAALMVGLAGPAWLLTQTAFARARGWTPESSALLWLGVSLVFALAAALALAFVTPWTRDPARRNARRFAALSLALTFGLVFADRLFPLLAPRPAFHCRHANARYDFRPAARDYFGVGSTAPTTYNAHGLRGRDLPTDPLTPKVLCLGGGTTECLYVADAQTWSARLEANLARSAPRVPWVGAAATADAASGHHRRFATDSPLLDRVDLVVSMLGAGDLMRLFLGLDFGDVPPPGWYQSWTADTLREIWSARLRRARILADPSGEFFSHQRRFLPMPPPARELDLVAASAAYGARVAALIKAIKDRGVPCLLVTQPALWSDSLSAAAKRRLLVARIFPAGREWDLLAPEKLHPVLDKWNATLARVAERENVPVVDAARELNGREEFFFDDFHLNDAGCAALAELVAPSVRAALESRREPPKPGIPGRGEVQ